MSSTAAGWLQFALLVVALAACYVPLGNYMARIFTAKEHWRVERGIYKLCGIDPEADMRWSVYARSMLAFSLVSVLFLYLIERTQHWLFLSVGMANVNPVTAWNTAASFTTNTNWQNYSGESTMSYLTQMSADWRCRTSCPPRSAWRWRSRSSAGSSGPGRTSSATSGST